MPEFVMVSVLLLFLLFGVLQVAVFCYARNIIGAAAADAARYAAAAGVPASAGGPRAEQLIGEGLGSAQAAAISCTSGVGTDADSRLPVTTVRCSGRIRALLAPVSIPLHVHFTASALRELIP